jgi:hypothetical protein
MKGMEKTPQVFTLEAVNALVPRLNELVGRQIDRRAAIERRLRDLSNATGEVPEAIVLDPEDPPDVADIKKELVGRIEEYQSSWREIEDMGAVLKDARMGLVDFYGTVEGKLVWLCWKYGENEVSHYHALDEGFSGRKELRQSIRHRLLN